MCSAPSCVNVSIVKRVDHDRVEDDAHQLPSGDSAEYKRLMQQHKTLQGMYNSQDARIREAGENNQALNAQITDMRNTFSSMQQQPQQQAPQPSQAGGLTQDEEREYSPGFFQMMSRWLGPQLQPIMQQLEAMNRNAGGAINQVNDQLQNVAQSQYQNDSRNFYGQLQAIVPDWQAINDDIRFDEWLQGPDPMSGVIRQVLVDDARKSLDFNRAAQFFLTFKRDLSASGTAVPQVTNNISLNDQAVVQPTRRTQSVGTDQQTAAKQYTSADLLKLYDDERRGKYKGNEDQFRKREVEIHRSINEGRYTQ